MKKLHNCPNESYLLVFRLYHLSVTPVTPEFWYSEVCSAVFATTLTSANNFLEAGHTVMVKYSNGKTMWGDYWAIILSLNGFCPWVSPCEHWSHTGLLHTLHYLIHHVASDVLFLNRLKRGQLKKSNFSSSIGNNLFSTVSHSKHHSGEWYFSSLLHTNVHFPYTSSGPFCMHPQHFTAC